MEDHKRKINKNKNSQVSFLWSKSAVFVPLVLALLLVISAFGMLMHSNLMIAGLSFLMIVIAGILVYAAFKQAEKAFKEKILTLTEDINSIENEILLQIPLGIILFDDDESIRWMNPYMQNFFKNSEALGNKISEVDDSLFSIYTDLKKESQFTHKGISWENHYLNVGLLQDQHAMYLLDITEYGEIAEIADKNRLVIGNILIDNYDENISGYTDRRKSNVDNFITKQFAAWARKFGSFVKRLDDDRFLLVSTYGKLLKMEEDKFSIIDSIREATLKANFPITISIGVSYQDKLETTPDIGKMNELAQTNLDLALSRGGDQVVVKIENEKARYYGGKTNPMEKRTHVRSRQIAMSIAKMMERNESIFVMGHDYPDMDAIGACLGIRRIAEMNQRKCYIILNESRINHDIEKLLVELRKDENIRNSIISPEMADEMMQASSLLFIVDVHRPSITVAPKLIEKGNGVVVIDHHRKGEEFPENVLLEYIEPYASSTCELITEFFQYQSTSSQSVNRIEATTMLAGIIIDSRNFSLRTGSRTFDAASYLKSCGADSIMIQEFLKEDLSDYIKRSQLIENVEIFPPYYGIAIGDDHTVYSTVVAAQAADTLLSMNGIVASFVIYLREDKRVGISARSMGNVNVQTIMEKLGGGGHLSNAATQISGMSVTEAKDALLEVIKGDDSTE
ncbi:DHH family phosphoesterase [Aerococcus christensenii]|uniref:DHH family phosphoesterase n=1 Tax=Aerococcus christensenii TaxID=87541 RepID=UPI0023A92350|nr:DHH family phosphoesterase [Aerococcus christensenii]WEB71025.1 DHH family phosphoesterase [Aerococcus christensenii]